MKKILGVSFAAMLAVSPMLANAKVTATSAPIAAANTDVTASTNVATTSYVKGAYKAMATEVNKVQADVANVISDINVTTEQEITGGVVKNANSVAGNLVALDTKVGTKQDQLKNDAGVPANISSTVKTTVAAAGATSDTALVTESAVRSAVDAVSTNMSSNYQLKTDSEVTSAARDAAGLTSADLNEGQGVGANLIKVASTAKANKDEIGTYDASGSHTYVTDANSVHQNLQALDAQVTTNTGALTTLNSADTVAGSVANTVKTTAASANYNNTTSGLSATTLQGAIDALDTAIDGISTTAQNFATKEGVVATINKATADGSVTVYTTWGDETVTDDIAITSDVKAPGNANNEYYASASATGEVQPKPAQP